MGVDALEGNGITRKILYFFRDRALTPADDPLRRVRKSRILLFVGVQLAGFGATMAVTQTIGTFNLHSCPERYLPSAPFSDRGVYSCYWVSHNHSAARAGANTGGLSTSFHG